MYVKSDSIRGLLELAMLATSAAGLLYFGYFQLAPWVWSQSVPYNPAEITHWYLPEMEERDGVELYVLYAMMFLNLFSVYALSYGWNRLAGKPVRYLFGLLLVLAACAFIGAIGFHPPVSTIAELAVPDIVTQSLTVMAVVLPVTLLLYYLQQRSAQLVFALAALLLIPVCFISTRSITWHDYQFILAPALRLFHGANVSEIYLPYDLLLSLVGLAWIKLQLDPNLFQVVGQGAFYLLLLGLFVFSRRWFVDKRLPVFLLVALVLVRIYAVLGGAATAFQVTPIRLDLWLILLLLVYFKGPHHWSAGVFCGLLLLLHHNFGLIYSAAYIQLLLTLCVINTVKLPAGIIRTAQTAAIAFFKRNYPNFALMLAGAVAHYLLFKNPEIQDDLNFIRMGIGFAKIATDSFYWYVVAGIGLSFMLLLRLRTRIPDNYLAASFCLIYLVIGNSLYFFGRSHENNIINISAILLLLFFLLLDLAGLVLAKDSGKPAKLLNRGNLGILVSLVLIASITVWYGGNIIAKAAAQAHIAGKGQFVYPSRISKQSVLDVIAQVKPVTGDNPKVYFVDYYDFLFDYYGGYAPVGYYNPMHSLVSRREFEKFLQRLLDEGYYLVIAGNVIDYGDKDALAFLMPANYRVVGKRLVAWR